MISLQVFQRKSIKSGTIPVREGKQLDRPGLEESDLDWDSPAEPAAGKPTPQTQAAFESVVKNIQAMGKNVKKSYRAQRDLAGWKSKIRVKTAGGNFFAVIKDGEIEFKKGSIPGPELTMITEDPNLFQKWMDSKEALTNAIVVGQLWISKNSEFKTVFKLDRLSRSLRRT